jgi:hypothetical protein
LPIPHSIPQAFFSEVVRVLHAEIYLKATRFVE